MLIVVYADCALMLSVTYKLLKPSVVMLNVVLLSAVAPIGELIDFWTNFCLISPMAFRGGIHKTSYIHFLQSFILKAVACITKTL